MNKAWKYVGIAALVVVLALGSVAAVTFAQESADDTAGAFDFTARFRENLAGLLGISVEQYDSAVVQARDETLAAAVAAGALTQDQADRMRERMEQSPDAMSWDGGPGRHGRGPAVKGVSLLAVAAEQLGMTQDDLEAALQAGQTIAGLAAEKGVATQTIVDAYSTQLTAELDQAVAAGEITQQQADATLAQAQTRAAERLNAAWEELRPSGGRGGHGELQVPPDRPSHDAATGTDS